MRTIPISPIPNQQLSVTLDGNRWVLTLKEANGVMCCDVVLNEVTLLSGQRVVAGSPIIPYRYLQTSGNFWILTENDDYPEYTQFGDGQILVYMSVADIEAIEATPNAWPTGEPFLISQLLINSLAIVLRA